jgi:hypothetical protein
MSNRYNGKYIVVDTTNTQLGGESPTGGPTGSLAIRLIQWVNTEASPITNNADLKIEWRDANGDIVIAGRACVHETATSQDIGSVVFYEANFGSKPWIVPGLYIEDLDAGELQIFLD